MESNRIPMRWRDDEGMYVDISREEGSAAKEGSTEGERQL